LWGADGDLEVRGLLPHLDVQRGLGTSDFLEHAATHTAGPRRWCPRTRAMRGLLRLRYRGAAASPGRRSPLIPPLLGLRRATCLPTSNGPAPRAQALAHAAYLSVSGHRERA